MPKANDPTACRHCAVVCRLVCDSGAGRDKRKAMKMRG
jgi:hypothetical protein